MGKDRREIARLLLPHFPSMAKATSEEWGAFLDEATGLVTPLDEPNASAFDRWRQALAEQGFPVWGISEEKAASIKARAEVLKQEEATRLAEQPELMAKLKKEAPLVTAAELIKEAKKPNG
jgi:hypothetical protein